MDNIPTFTPIRTDTIQCPECNTIQDATVEQVEGAPWPSFVHTCEKCGYTIMESEWEIAEIKPYLQYLDELARIWPSGYWITRRLRKRNNGPQTQRQTQALANRAPPGGASLPHRRHQQATGREAAHVRPHGCQCICSRVSRATAEYVPPQAD